MSGFLFRVLLRRIVFLLTFACITGVTAIAADLSIIDESGATKKLALDGTKSVSLAASAGGDVTLRFDGFYVQVSTNPIDGTQAGLKPAFANLTQTDDGFTVEISNYDADYTWVVTSDAGTVSNNGKDVTVSGLSPGQSAKVTVTTKRTGYSDASDSITGQAKQTSTTGNALEPAVGEIERTADGFKVPITNFDATFTWETSVDRGTASLDEAANPPTAIVTGLTPGQTATLTITTSKQGHDSGTRQVLGQALADSSTGADTSSYCKGSYEYPYEVDGETLYWELNRDVKDEDNYSLTASDPADRPLVDCRPERNFDPWVRGTPEVQVAIKRRLTQSFPFTLPARADAADVSVGYLQFTTGETARLERTEDFFHVWISEVPNGKVLGDYCEKYMDQADQYFYWTQDASERKTCYLGTESKVMYVNFETACSPDFYPGGADACNLKEKRKSSREYLFDVARGFFTD